MKTINFGIDLGTTNSAIAKFIKGDIEVFKNPAGFKDTLPSVVKFRKDYPPLVGDKARDFLQRDPRDVFFTFKRKMGTSESFKVASLGRSVTPIELSAYVLKELKNFVHTGETVEHVVITIPASFDTIQSNATKQAGMEAGFQTVELLQEPIAASLAYANKTKEEKLKDGQWLVYDLGGGTFDVALVKTCKGEMSIVDHEGDNFLGGSDFDALIIQKLIIPYLQEIGDFTDFEHEARSASGKYNKEWFMLMDKAEDAKIELSSKLSSEIDFTIKDQSGEEHDVVMSITRTELEGIIRPLVDNTVNLIKKILSRNSLTNNDIQFILMVGGSTHIPFVRNRVTELLQIKLNFDIDPTTAIVVGAAYYAGTRSIREEKVIQKEQDINLKVKVVYNKASQDSTELFSAKITGNIDGKFYRIIRADGGYDTGLRTLTERISEDLPLLEDAYNNFMFQILDQHNNPIPTDVDQIEIAHGKYSIAGQPVPHDISIEIDDPELPGKTKLLKVFSKNSILPLQKTVTLTTDRIVEKGFNEDILHINILEGSSEVLPQANWSLGYMQVAGKQSPRDILKGADVEVTLSLSESRDLAIKVYIPMIDLEFTEVFKPRQRDVSLDKLLNELSRLQNDLESNITEAMNNEDYLVVKDLKAKEKELNQLIVETKSLSTDDVTDSRYQLEDRKRKKAQEIDELTKDKRIKAAKMAYFEEKENCVIVVNEGGNDYERRTLKGIIGQEPVFLDSNSILRIEEKREALKDIRLNVLWRTPSFLVGLFNNLSSNPERFNNPDQAKIFIEAGKNAVQNEHFERLAEINMELIRLLPREDQETARNFIGLTSM